MRSSYALRGGWLMVLLLASAASALGQVAAPDTARILDLSSLLDELRSNNPSLRAAHLAADGLATQRRQVSALPEPMAMVTYQPVPVVTARGWQRTQWRVEQAIPYPGKRALRGTVADLSAGVAEQQAEELAQDLVLQAKQAYYDLYRVQEQDRLITAFQEQLRDFEEVAASRYEVGIGTQQAVLKAQLEHNRLHLRREQLAADRQSALETLARLLDRPDTASLDGVVRVEEPDADLDGDALLAVALERRPEAEALRLADTRADRRIDLARKDFLPDFSVSATYFDIADGDVPMSADGRDALAFGVGVKLPLWRGKLRAGLEEAEVERRQVASRLEALETAFRTQIDDLLSQLDRQQRQLDLYQETLIPQAETTLEATLSAYNTGQAGFLDLLDAERSLFALRLDEAATLTRTLQTTAALERTLGVASLTDL